MKKKSPPLFTSKGEWSTLRVYPKRKGNAVGVAIPRSLFPHSTSRNRLRRQIREAIRILNKKKELAPQRTIIQQGLLIHVQKGGKPPSYKTIQGEMKRHLTQLESSQ